MKLNPNKIGIAVTCAVCGLTKKPVGRDASLGSYLCQPIRGDLPGGCEGYYQEPHIGSLWPGESEADFGYPVGDAGTREE